MNNSNKKKSNQLGMPIGTAQAILKKNILYNLLVRFNLNKCYQCGNTIDKVEELSIEHKTPWLDSDTPKELFFNLENIAFSHLSCNCRARRSNTELMKKSTINRVYDGNHNGRLSPSKVEEIRELLRVNSRRKVAEITGASKTTIARIARGEIYKYI
nr:MAG TPA: antitoxin [Bacteriophage sp.]DAR01898.1 MAG TPA: antitoxin [Crassvirales sp.]